VTVVAQGADPGRFPDAQLVLTDDAAVGATGDIAAGSFVVVATQGRRDLQGLRAALALQARRVFFVASARKAQVLKAALVEAGADARAVAAIVAPAGEPIGAQTPEEIALSVLAAVVAARRRGDADSAPAGDAPAAAEAAVRGDGPPPASAAPNAANAPDAAAVTAADAPAGPPRSRLGALLDKLPNIELPPGRGGCCGG
jgi:xanthine dehydrogenase accessory factor